MSALRPKAIDLARAVVAAEGEPGSGGPDASTLMGKLAVALGKLIGSNGFDVLLGRAIKLAAREEPALASVVAAPGGRLEGLSKSTPEGSRCLTVLLSHLCELLMKFIGEDLTTRVFHDVWPPLAAGRNSEEKRT